MGRNVDMKEKYTGREIAIFTDIHGLLYPTLAILEDIKKRGIEEIYSLGDNIGVGPHPSEVLDLLGEYNVKTISGNNEEYYILGMEPFQSFFNEKKRESREWTLSHLTAEQLENLKKNKHSYTLEIGGKKVGLCHFANDVRIDFGETRSTWSYQKSINANLPNPQEQFYYTNSPMQKEEIEEHCKTSLPKDLGYVSAKKDPLFAGKTIDTFDEIIQGHVHFRFLTEDEKVKIRTIRAVGMAFKNDPLNFASYIMIKEKEIGYDVMEILVPFNRELMLKSIDESTIPEKDVMNMFVLRK